MPVDRDYDVLVMGAGLGGLTCSAKLAYYGLRVLLLEKKPHAGGTSYFFQRMGYAFPMGPLSFSHPGIVQDILKSVGCREELTFQRSHFQFVSPDLDIRMSLSFPELEERLGVRFPGETSAVRKFFQLMKEAIQLTHDRHVWHPDYGLARVRPGHEIRKRVDQLARFDHLEARELCSKLFSDPILCHFLGSQGSTPPRMSVSYLASMWDILSQTGIWFPGGGTRALVNVLSDAVKAHGGDIRTDDGVKEVLVQRGRITGVVSQGSEKPLKAAWYVSNINPKTLFGDLIAREKLPSSFRSTIEDTPYTGSEVCVYLGVNPAGVDTSRMRAPHVIFRRVMESRLNPALDDFDHREFEICYWSSKDPGLAPKDKASFLLRCGFPYDYFSLWRTGERRRSTGYQDYKTALALRLIKTAEGILPGLSDSIDLMEVATPLTYRDWGYRHEGALAGWTWQSRQARDLPGKLLIRTPFPNLLLTGIFAASELFLGGVPTAMITGSLAADSIIARM